MKVVKSADLPWSEIAHELVGSDFGLGVTLLFVAAEPGRGPRLHKHPYAEVFIIQEGRATFTTGDEQVELGPGSVLIVEPEEPHAFVNTGSETLRQIDIHLSADFSTEWL